MVHWAEQQLNVSANISIKLQLTTAKHKQIRARNVSRITEDTFLKKFVTMFVCLPIAWKNNFLRIKKLVLIGGRDDGLITPWQSRSLDFYHGCNEV